VKRKTLIILAILHSLIVIFAFITAQAAPQTPQTAEEGSLNDLSTELEGARQRSLDEDLDELEQTLDKDEKELSEGTEDPFTEKSEPPAEEPMEVESIQVEPAEALPAEAQTEEAEVKTTPAPQSNTPVADAKVVLEKPSERKSSPQHWGFTLMGGRYKPADYIGKGDPFDTIYTGDNWFLNDKGLWVDAAMEYQLLKKFGRLGLKGTSGVWVIRGLHDATSDSTIHKRQYSLIALPLFIGPVYRFQYWTRQPLIPFIEAAYGGFQFQQTQGATRDRYTVYRSATFWGLGLQLNGNFVDEASGNEFDINWGVNQTSFMVHFRRINSLTSDKYDFSGQNLILAGLLFEF